MIALGPEAHAEARRGAARTACTLSCRGGANFFDEKRIDAAIRIVARHPREARVHHQSHAIDRQRCLGDIGGNNHLSPIRAVHRTVLLGGRELAMQRQNGATPAKAPLQLADGALDFIGPRHEDEHITFGALKVLGDCIRCRFPDWIVLGIVREMADFNGKHASFGGQGFGGREIFLKLRTVESGRHDDDFQVGPDCVLQIESPRQRDVSIEVPLVEFIEDQSGNATQLRVGQHLTKKNTLGDEEDFRLLRGNIVEPYLIAHLATQAC